MPSSDPRGTIPGTRMAYGGMRNVQDRANLIAWLRDPTISSAAD